jgi:protein arginine kinase activator
MRDLLRRLTARQRRRAHSPGAPAPTRRLDLRDRLRRAVETENFELAAEIRDRLRVLE